MKERSRQSEEVTWTIIQNCTSEFSVGASSAIPKKEIPARMVCRQPKTLKEDILTEGLQKSVRIEDFDVYESDNVLILSTP